VIATTI
jgi:hypothetical protein